MRLITFILSSGIALTWIPACASAQSNTFSQGKRQHHNLPQARGLPGLRAGM
jgi:hypothetical protein